MVYAVILAGGCGLRMGNMEKPKQYIELGGKPVLIHTIEKFLVYPYFEKIIVLCPRQWIAHTNNMLTCFMKNTEDIVVIEGGNTRNDTIMNAITYIETEYSLENDPLIVTHDAVRPFVTERIIRENIEAAKKYGACDTVIPATDTIVESKDGQMLTSIPDRAVLYQGQTPQTFRARMLKDSYQGLSDDEKNMLTDAAKICVIKGQPVKVVRGEVFNIKITYPYDLNIANSLLGGE